MPGTYSLELELFSTLSSTASDFEIWADGVLLGGYSNIVSSGGSTISIASVAYGGALPTSLEFRFNDTLGGVQQIEVRSVKINDRYVNTNNYLSGTTLNEGGSQTVDVSNNAYLFDASEPAPSEFTTGATQTFDGTNNTYRDYNGTTDQVFNMLGGRDVALLGSGNDKVAGDAGDDYIRGGAGNDLLYGGADNDRIYGGADDDIIYGGTGNDRLHGDAGNDEIHGGDGDDALQGNDGNDIITGGAGADRVHGGNGDDYLFGDAGDDQMTGGNGADTLDGGAGNDLIYGGAGIDHMNGGDGDDIMVGDTGDDVLHGDAGDDIMYGMADNDEIYGGAGNDYIVGGTGNDAIDGGTGEDEIFGSDGVDDIDGGDGHDVTWGGDGNDTINTGAGDDIVFADGGANASGWIFKYYDLGSSPTTLATAGFTKNSGMDNSLAATSQGITQNLNPSVFDTGDNYALKYETFITITTAGNYTFRTRSDDGSALFLNGTQIVDNDGLHGAVTVTSAAQTLAAGVYKLDATFFERTGGNVMEVTMSGPDTASVYVDLGAYASVNPANGSGSVISGDDIINTGDGNDTIYGDLGADTIDAGAGDDLIYLANNDFAAGESIDGGADTDELILTNATTVDFTTGTLANLETLTGSAGNDDVTYEITQALDFTTIDLGGGTDNSRVQVAGTVDVTALGTPTVANAENGYLTGSELNDDLTITGAQLDALIFGSGTIDFLGNGSGSDILNLTSTSADLNSLGFADASIQGLEEISASTAGAGVNIWLFSQTEDFTVTGSAFNDTLYLGSGDDVIDGGTGNDTIYGSAGSDIIDGGTGDDYIEVWDTDFGAGESITGGADTDTLEVSGTIDFTTGTLNTLEILLGQDGPDNITISGAQLDQFTTIDMNSNTDTLNITSTSTTFNGLNDASLSNLEQISASTAAAGVVINLSAQTEGFIVTGSAQADTITGGSGADIITGGAGVDIINGGNGNDTINLANGDFTGAESLTGGNDTDTLLLTNATTVNFTTGTLATLELLIGSAGSDLITIAGTQLNQFTTINLNGGTDTLFITSTSTGLNALADGSLQSVETISAATAGAGVTITLSSQTEGFTVIGSGNADTITGGTGADIITGGNGNDTINLANGHFAAGESLTGGAGTDNITLTNATTVNFTTGTLTTIEDFIGSTGNDDVTLSITQFFGFTTIDYGGGTDAQTISIAGVNDVTALMTPAVSNLESGTLIASAGADNLTITGAQLDAFTTGLTTLNFLGGADVLNITSTSANLNAYGANDGNLLGLETISASTAGSSVEISMSGQTESFTITGGSFADTLTGGSAADIIDGGDGDNILTGLDGNDTITGGTGNDTILGGNGDDILIGGAGDDTIYGATIIGESGVETVVQTNSTTWHTVTFSAAILNPVVKMSNMTNNDGDYYVVRVRDVTETGFEWQIDEFDYLDGSRILSEDVSWIAIAEGTHTLDNGLVVQAGMASATNENFTTITFNSAFGSAPVVMTQVMSDNDSAAVGTRNRNRTTTNFEIQMLEEEAADGTHSTEDIGWIAIDNGGAVGTGFLVGETTDSVTHNVTTVNFGSAFDNTPVVLHDQQTRDGGDTSYSQADGITTSTARFFIGEEQSNDAEVNHTTEVVGYYALNEGLLTSANGGDNTFTGGAGLDTLYGGDGLDTFIFESASAFADRDILADFSTGEGDVLDISDLIVGVFSGTITDYVNFDDSSGTDTVVQVDANGLTGGSTFSDIAIINGITGLDEATLYTNGNIIV